LFDRRPAVNGVTPASVTRGFPPTELVAVESSWGPARAALAADVRAAGFDLENAHWDWQNKLRHYQPGWHCLVAVEADGDVQGLMAVESRLARSEIDPAEWVVYVDFLEVAPWNRREPNDRRLPAVQEPRFAGVGTLLVGEAVRMSVGQTASGRVGLHALPAAEEFYATRCRMTGLGLLDHTRYPDLAHFEYPDGVAIPWLTTVGLSA
jgi:hypothetical protein